MRWLTYLGWLACLLLLLGCRSKPLYAPPADLADGVYVHVYEAHTRGDRLGVKAVVTNKAAMPIHIDWTHWTLRADELVLRPTEGRSDDRVVVIMPGRTRSVLVDFKQPGRELEQVADASLIVGGVRFGDDPELRVVGEIPLSRQRPSEAMYGQTAPEGEPVERPAALPAEPQASQQ